VIRFERNGDERFAHWFGGEAWRPQRSLHRLFAEAESGLDAGGEMGVGDRASLGDARRAIERQRKRTGRMSR